MVVHHVAAMVAIWRALYTNTAHALVLAFLATEATTPLINMRFWLLKAGRQHTALYRWLAVAILCGMSGVF